MEQGVGDISLLGMRQSNLKKSFKLAIRSLLMTCSKENFMNAFPTLNRPKEEALFLMFIQVISSVHHNIDQEFESICNETQVITALDTVEQLVEERALDVLSKEKLNTGILVEVKQDLSEAKKDGIRHLTSILEKLVDQNQVWKAQIDSLKKEKLDSLGTTDAVEKLRKWNSEYVHQ